MEKVKYLKCTYDQWDEAIQKSKKSVKKKHSTRYKKAKTWKNAYAR